MTFFWLKRHAATPSDEAIQARTEADNISKRAATVYGERRKILDENHFAERIRLIYEGRP